MKNPFPGMNPWLEEYWQDIHASFLIYARGGINLVEIDLLRGRYGSILDYSQPPQPPLPDEETAWVKQVLASP